MTARRQQTELFVILSLSWLVYGVCQRDLAVPEVAFVLVLLSYLKQMFGRPAMKNYLDVSWRVTVGVAMFFGLMWRTAVQPPPEDAVAFFPVVLPALQTATIAVAVAVWFRFAYRWRTVALIFLAWLTVALSVNVPFSGLTILSFWLFCCISIGFLVVQVYRPPEGAPQDPAERSSCLTPLTVAYPVLLTGIAMLIFFVLITGIKLGDEVFMYLVRDYMAGRYSRFFDSSLRLTGSSYSRYDVKPVMEISRDGRPGLYLVGQVFEQYDNGVWQAPEDLPKEPVPVTAGEGDAPLAVTMYEHIEDVIPVPRGVAAMASPRGGFVRDTNGIVTNLQKTIPVATVWMGSAPVAELMDRATYRKLTQVPAALSPALRLRTDRVLGPGRGALVTARQLQQYFRRNFRYDLNVDFNADDDGLLYMLDHRRPAYCSYFASAMTLMLRQRGIPARLTAGFLAMELSRLNKGRFIVRGRDAHAWVEAFIPEQDPVTGQAVRVDGGISGRWVKFDPTPPDLRVEAINGIRPINLIADYIWCTMKRTKAGLINMETRTLTRILFVLIFVIVLEEVLKKYFPRLFLRGSASGQDQGGWDKDRRNPYEQEYRQFEEWVKRCWGVGRKPGETVEDFLASLSVHPDMLAADLEQMDTFLRRYQNGRFGLRAEPGLGEAIKNLMGGDAA